MPSTTYQTPGMLRKQQPYGHSGKILDSNQYRTRKMIKCGKIRDISFSITQETQAETGTGSGLQGLMVPGPSNLMKQILARINALHDQQYRNKPATNQPYWKKNVQTEKMKKPHSKHQTLKQIQ